MEGLTVYPHRLAVDYTNNERMMNNACLSRQVLNQNPPKIDCTKEVGEIKDMLWKEYRKIFKHEKGADYLTMDMLIADNHACNYHDIVKNRNYLEILTSDNQLWTDTEKVKKEWDAWKQKKWVVSCNAKIMVIDERIQDFALKSRYHAKGGETIGYVDIYQNTNILVPDGKIDLNEQNFDASYSSIIGYIQTQGDIDFLVIHLGIIEKLISSYNKNKNTSYNKENQEQVRDFIRNVLCGYPTSAKIEYDQVVVISGRGKPHNLPHDVRYLNYSIVAQYLIDHRCKYVFAEAIYSARKFNQ
jgi:hypothetical protein